MPTTVRLRKPWRAEGLLAQLPRSGDSCEDGGMTALDPKNDAPKTEATPELKKLLERLTSGDAMSIVENGVVLGELRRAAPELAPWDVAQELSKSVPESAWDAVPQDLAKDFDHYHYGHPRAK